MSLKAGNYVELQVKREVSPNGFFLSNGEEDVLLHYTELTREVKLNDRLEVFLYHDTEGRLSATMKRPLLQLGELALLEVVDIHPRLGCFLEIGLGRNLLLPMSDLPDHSALRPLRGDKVYATMTHDRQGRLMAKLAGVKELKTKTFGAPATWKNQWVEGRVYNPLETETFVLCEGGLVGFGVIGMIHVTDRTRTLRLGEKVKARVTFVREDGHVNLSMISQKEVGRDEDSAMILAYLHKQADGSMPFTDDSSAESINEQFRISKSAFKRALGKLMKENLVYQEAGFTFLKKPELNEVSE
ncbi:MAG TPA: S1-like domain-containing RNA-binding protein [Bacilli bacterium]